MNRIETYKSYFDDETLRLVARTLAMYDKEDIFKIEFDNNYKSYKFALCYILSLLGRHELSDDLIKLGFNVEQLQKIVNIDNLNKFNQSFNINNIEEVYENASRDSKQTLINSINLFKYRKIKYDPRTYLVANMCSNACILDIFLNKQIEANTGVYGDFKDITTSSLIKDIIINDYEMFFGIYVNRVLMIFGSDEKFDVDLDDITNNYYNELRSGNIIGHRVIADKEEIEKEIEFIKNHTAEEYFEYKKNKSFGFNPVNTIYFAQAQSIADEKRKKAEDKIIDGEGIAIPGPSIYVDSTELKKIKTEKMPKEEWQEIEAHVKEFKDNNLIDTSSKIMTTDEVFHDKFKRARKRRMDKASEKAPVKKLGLKPSSNK